MSISSLSFSGFCKRDFRSVLEYVISETSRIQRNHVDRNVQGSLNLPRKFPDRPTLNTINSNVQVARVLRIVCGTSKYDHPRCSIFARQGLRRFNVIWTNRHEGSGSVRTRWSHVAPVAPESVSRRLTAGARRCTRHTREAGGRPHGGSGQTRSASWEGERPRVRSSRRGRRC